MVKTLYIRRYEVNSIPGQFAFRWREVVPRKRHRESGYGGVGSRIRYCRGTKEALDARIAHHEKHDWRIVWSTPREDMVSHEQNIVHS